MRPRKTGNEDLPLHVSTSGDYFVYTHPITGKRHGLGRDRANAIRDGRLLNERIVVASERVNKILLGKESKDDLNHYIDMAENDWKKRVAEKKLSKNTLSKNLTYAGKIRDKFGERLPSSIRAKELEDWLDTFSPSARQVARSVLSVIWEPVMRLEELDNNVVQLTSNKQPDVARKRLSLAMFMAIRKEAKELSPILAKAMTAMIHTAMRPGDLLTLKKRNLVRDKDPCCLLVRPSKTKNKTNIAIKMELSPPAIAAFDAFRDDVVSEYILHYPFRKGRHQKFTGRPLQEKFLSKEFKKVRDIVFAKQRDLFVTPVDEGGIDSAMRLMEYSELPTLYEIRSLSLLLHDEAEKEHGGQEGIKRVATAVAGHSDESTTEFHYLSRHPLRWTEVKVGLDFE